MSAEIDSDCPYNGSSIGCKHADFSHLDLSDNECDIKLCKIHGIRLEDGTRVPLSTSESLEAKVDRIDHNLQVLLDTVQQVVGSFEKNPMAKMFMNRMGK